MNKLLLYTFVQYNFNFFSFMNNLGILIILDYYFSPMVFFRSSGLIRNLLELPIC